MTTDWVNCPICHEPDMKRETDADENALIFCVNHACPSNGGDAPVPVALSRAEWRALVEVLRRSKFDGLAGQVARDARV